MKQLASIRKAAISCLKVVNSVSLIMISLGMWVIGCRGFFWRLGVCFFCVCGNTGSALSACKFTRYEWWWEQKKVLTLFRWLKCYVCQSQIGVFLISCLKTGFLLSVPARCLTRSFFGTRLLLIARNGQNLVSLLHLLDCIEGQCNTGEDHHPVGERFLTCLLSHWGQLPKPAFPSSIGAG